MSHKDHSHGHDYGYSHDHEKPHELSFEEKLEKLLVHWIEHNKNHADTFFTWAQRAQEKDLNKIAEDIKKAGDLSSVVTKHLKNTLKKFSKKKQGNL